MIFRATPFILILFVSCRTASMTNRMRSLAEDNKDVVILSYLIRDYMRKTDSTNFTLVDIVKNDSLGLITKNFSALEVANWRNPWRGGYSVYYKFKDGRNKDSVKLTQYQRIPWKVKTKKEIGRNDEQVAKKFDGEIHFYYTERFYHIREIIFKIPTH